MLIRNDRVNAFLDHEETAVAHAEEGPLKGLTFGVKDTGCVLALLRRMESG